MGASFVFPQAQNINVLVPYSTFGANVAAFSIAIPSNPYNVIDIIVGIKSPDAVATRSFIAKLNNDGGANYDYDGIGLVAGNPTARAVLAAANLLGSSCNGTTGLANEYATYWLTVFNNKRADHKQGWLAIKDKTGAAAGDNYENVLWRWRNTGEITSLDISMAVGLMDTSCYYKVIGRV